MPKADVSNTTRRRLFASAPVLSHYALSEDPIIALYTRWRAVEDEQAVAEQRHTALIAELTHRHGDRQDMGTERARQADPAYSECGLCRARSDELNEEITRLLEVMIALPATSIEGIVCKMRAALEVWTFVDRRDYGPEFHEEMTIAFMRDAARMLGGSVGV